jgi:hypothetical protein
MRRISALSGAAVAGGAGLLTAVALSGVALSATSTDTLAAGATLAAGQQIISSDAHYRLTMEANGDLVEHIAEFMPSWWSATSTAPTVHRLVLLAWKAIS